MTSIKRLMKENLSFGIVDLTIDSLSTFNNVVTEMLDYPHYIWRGQRSSKWLLEPTLNRLLREIDLDMDNINKVIVNHLENFKYATRGRRGSTPKLDMTDDEWWAL